jgi:zinc protease
MSTTIWRIVLLVAPVALSSLALEAQTLPVDSAIKTGILPNGLRYYIRKNTTPAKRAELRLIVNAGSILETEDQLGLAHFIEHMAFNGTTHFAKNSLVGYLQSIGVRFGADLNATTSFDETEYILPVPTSRTRELDSAFTILADWAHGQLFDSAEVVAERGVVREEWRGGRGAGERMLRQWLPIVFGNSQYAQRVPIGTESSIMSATPSRLRAYYRDWYRPDLMAVVAVGDFDPVAVEREIKQHFGEIPAGSRAPERKSFAVPIDTVPVVAIATDKEATSSVVSVMFLRPRTPTMTVADHRKDLVGSLLVRMLNARLSEIVLKPGAPFLSAVSARQSFLARDLGRFSLDARVQSGGAEKAVEALLVEVRRAANPGFLQSELDRARAGFLSDVEHSYLERNKTQSVVFAEELVRNFLTQEPIPGVANEFKLAREIVPSITLDELNATLKSWTSGVKPIVIFQGPTAERAAVPTVAGIRAALDRGFSSGVVAYTEEVSGAELVDAVRARGKIIAKRSYPSIGVTEWKLSNGARVLIKPTDFKADEILLGGYAPGGTAAAADKDFVSATFASQVTGVGGLGKFSVVELRKKLAGKTVGLTSGISETLHEFGGRAAPHDLEALLQLVYLEMTAPRLDTSAISALRANVQSVVAGRGASPDAVFQDTVQVTLAQHDFRARPLTAATFSELDNQRAFDFFRKTFSSGGDFTFVFVGNVDTTTLRPLVEKYLASLPPKSQTETATSKTRGFPGGVIEKTVRKGLEPKATTIIAFSGKCVYSSDTRLSMRAMLSVLQLRLNESLREKLGKTYSPSVRGNCNRIPRQEYLIPIQFGSATVDADTLTKTVFAIIDTLKTRGPSASDLEKVREQLLRTHEVDERLNQYWLASILVRDQAGEDLAGLAEPFEKAVNVITAERIRHAARQYFDFKNYARFVLLPES